MQDFLSLDSYIKSIKAGPSPLTKKEEREASPEKLAQHSMRLALSISARYFTGREEYDLDLLSTAINALVRQAQTFDSQKGRFSTVATHAIRRSIGIYRKKEAQHFIGYSKKDHIKYGYSLIPYEEEFSGSQEATQLNDLCEGDVETRIRKSLIILPSRQRRAIIHRYLIGRNTEDLAKSMGLTRDQLDRMCRSAIQKLKEVADAQ